MAFVSLWVAGINDDVVTLPYTATGRRFLFCLVLPFQHRSFLQIKPQASERYLSLTTRLKRIRLIIPSSDGLAVTVS
jgi:hypothetical protein